MHHARIAHRCLETHDIRPGGNSNADLPPGWAQASQPCFAFRWELLGVWRPVSASRLGGKRPVLRRHLSVSGFGHDRNSPFVTFSPSPVCYRPRLPANAVPETTKAQLYRKPQPPGEMLGETACLRNNTQRLRRQLSGCEEIGATVAPTSRAIKFGIQTS